MSKYRHVILYPNHNHHVVSDFGHNGNNYAVDISGLPVVIQPCFSQSSTYEGKNSLMETQESIAGIALSCNNMVCFVSVFGWETSIKQYHVFIRTCSFGSLPGILTVIAIYK